MMMSQPLVDTHATSRLLFVEADGPEFVVRQQEAIAMRCVSLWEALRSAMTLAADEQLTIVVDTPQTQFRLQLQ